MNKMLIEDCICPIETEVKDLTFECEFWDSKYSILLLLESELFKSQLL